VDVIGAGNKFKRKPNPESLLYTLKKNNLNPDEAIFIGDSIVDIHTAKNANIKSVGVLWGLGTKDQLLGENPDYLIKNPSELLAINGFV